MPITLNIIEDTKKSSNEISTEMYLSAVELAIANKNLTDNFDPRTCEVKEDGNLACDIGELVIDVKGAKPSSGTIKLKDGSIEKYEIVLNNKKYSNIEYTPDECFFTIDNRDGTATIKRYNCGEYSFNGNKIPGEYMDVVIPEEIYKTEIADAKVNMDLCKTYAMSLASKSEEEAIQMCNNIDKSSIEDKKSLIESNEAYIYIFDIKLKKTSEKLKVTKIGEAAFSDVDVFGPVRINSVVLPKTLKSIGINAFTYSNLTSVEIPDNVTEVENGAFISTHLTSVTIGKNVTSIGDNAFFNNPLTSVIINAPQSQVTIGYDAFGEFDTSKIQWASE